MKEIYKILLLLFLFSYNSQNHVIAQSGWYSIPSGTNSWLKDIQVVSQNAVYAVGYGYTILKSTDLGDSWTVQYSGQNYYNFLSLSFLNEMTGYVTGGAEYDPNPPVHYGVVFKTTNGGINWIQINQGGTAANNVICSIDSMKVMKASLMFTPDISISTDGGYTWTAIQGIGAYSISFINALTGFTAGTNQFSKTTNGGLNWTNYSLSVIAYSYPRKLSFHDQYTGYIIFDHSPPFIIKTTNEGINWSSPTNLPSMWEGFSLYCINRDTVFATGRINSANNGIILRSTDGCQTWTVQYNGGIYTDPYSISFLNSMTGFAVGPTGLILKTTTGGEYISSIGNENQNNPNSYVLHQNFPNPFNPITNIEFELLKDGFINITVYDNLGREVKTLVNEFKKAGSYKLDFDGGELSSGIYFYRLRTEEFTMARKMILAR